ncbi:MAG: EamA family transporter RarD [Anaerolineaceae bacterium]|nr:EamA family transporter RarD [Anaerolineaceae bacterium]
MNKGVFYSLVAYICWGFFPLFFSTLNQVPPFQVVSNRIVWSCLFYFVLAVFLHELPALRKLITKRVLLVYLIAGTLLAINWLTFVWAVDAGFVVETSLGYFINPLVSVMLGVVFLKERLRMTQWIPVGLATIGVAYLTISHGSLPWIALVLALTFGTYGLIKKIAPLEAVHGMLLESATITIPALAYLVFEEFHGVGAFWHSGTATTSLLIFSGIVTAVPLLLFAYGTRRISLTTVGLLQYINPTIQFLTGVFLFGEPFTQNSLIGFGIVWLALIVFSIEAILNRKKSIPVSVFQPNQ